MKAGKSTAPSKWLTGRLRPAAVLILLIWLASGCRQADRPPATDGQQVAVSATPARATRPALPTETATEPATAAIVAPTAAATAAATAVATATSTVAPAADPTATPAPEFPVYAGPPLDRSGVGVQIHLHREDLDVVMGHLESLGVGWVKSQVSWKLYEPQPEEYDDFRLAELDRLVERAAALDIRLMLSVAKAPEWSRSTTEMDGPPTDATRFRYFMTFLADRYRGRVAAYELWNEPNLKREWNGASLSAAALVELIRAGAEGVRAVDPEAILVSAAPAPTGINDGLVAIDDRLYFQQMVEAGVTGVVEAVGAHPYGWANPPDSTSAAPDPAVPSHNNHPSFFFADTLTDYRAILTQAGLASFPIWATEFGWGTYQGLGQEPPQGVAYMAHVDEWQQALYIMRAYEMAGEMADLGPMILWNLNFSPTFGPDFVESAYSLLRPDGSQRPGYGALASLTSDAGG